MTSDDPHFTARALQLLAEAFDVPAAQRSQWLAATTDGDAALRDEVLRMLAADERASGPLDLPLVQQFEVDEAQDARLGRRVGPYVLRALIGRGGMGRVYRGERDQGGFAQAVAVKLLRFADEDAPVRRRFERERQILVRLQHPNIARLLDGGVLEDGQPWYAMELVEGVPITRLAAVLPLRERLVLFMQVCGAVQYAHQNLVLHRDLKPDNILVDAQGQVRLLDFGIAKLIEPGDTGEATQTEMRAFTADYAAPEQLRGDAVSTATDVYALGVILYELLAARRPFGPRGGPQDEALPEPPSRVLARGGDARAASALRGDLDTLVLACLQPDAARRYGSAAALERDLERHLAGLPIEARPDTFGYRAAKFVRRHRVPVFGGALLAVALLLATAHSLRLADSLQRERDAAFEEAARQELLREHFTAVLNRAAESPDPIEPQRLFDLAANPNLLGDFGDATSRLALQLALVDLFVQGGDYPRALETLKQAEPELARAAPRQRAPAHANGALAAVRVGDLALAQSFVDAAEGEQTPEQRAAGMMPARLALMRGQLLRAHGDLAGSAVQAREAARLVQTATDGTAIERGAVFGSAGVALLQLGDLDAALDLTTRALAVWESANVSANASLPTARTTRANVLMLRGNLREAQAAIEAIDADHRVAEAPAARAARGLSMAKLLALLGEPAAALAKLDEARRGMCGAVGEASLDCLRAQAAGIDTQWFADDLPGARATITALQSAFATQPSPPLQAAVAQFDLVVALLEAADGARAHRVVAGAASAVPIVNSRLAADTGAVAFADADDDAGSDASAHVGADSDANANSNAEAKAHSAADFDEVAKVAIDARLDAVLVALPAGAQAGALPRRNAVRALLVLAQKFDARGDAARAQRLAAAALKTAGDAIDGDGMDRALLEIWRARSDGRAVPAAAIAQLEAALGPDHAWVLASRDSHAPR